VVLRPFRRSAFRQSGADGASRPEDAGPVRGEDEGVLTRVVSEMSWRLHRYKLELVDKQREIEVANERLREQNEQLRRANEVLEQLSVTDELTHLHNHRFFREALPREMKRSLRTGEPLSLILFDIDDFKHLNDRYGHAVGDAVLCRVADVMNNQVRDMDLLARYGGEEFVLLASRTPVEGAVALAEKIRIAVSRTPYSVIDLDGPIEIQVTISAGVAGFHGDDKKLFTDADRALYKAKGSGKDCVFAA